MALSQTSRFNYHDYQLIPEGKHYELIDGDFRSMTPAPTFFHQDILLNLTFVIKTKLDPKRLGKVCVSPIDVVLSEEDIVQPDLFIISKERKGIITRKEVRGAPDLVVEILSPSSIQWDRSVKMKLYYRHGVLEYWIVDPDQQLIEVYRRTPEGFSLIKAYPRTESVQSEIFPELTFSLFSIFAGLEDFQE